MNIKTSKVLVIGDTMLDIYINGEVTRISPEAPVPVLKKTAERNVLGGAANVVSNLIAANQKVSLLSIIGNDQNGKIIQDLFKKIANEPPILEYWDRATVTKTRFLAENNQQVFRLDIEDVHPISYELVTRLTDIVRKAVNDFDIFIISDYMKGLLTDELTQNIITIINSQGKKVLVDVKDSNFMKYKGAWLLKPNIKELHALTKMPVSTDKEIIEAAGYLLSKSQSKYILTTCGAKGMILVGNEMVYRLDAISKHVYDVTGAGDTTIAYLTAALASGFDIKEAMHIANYAAGLQVERVGTSVVSLQEVEQVIRSNSSYVEKRIFKLNERKELLQLVSKWRNNKEKIVTTNGCFDIIHKGHITLLENAKKFGDRLIVLINSDDSVKRIKGLNRPINSEEDRASIISAINCVDAVVLFDPYVENAEIMDLNFDKITEEQRSIINEAPMGILKLIAPDIHIKGGDYKAEDVPERVYAKEYKSIPFISGYSTTQIIEKIKSYEQL